MNPIVVVTTDDQLADHYVLGLRMREIGAVSVPDCAGALPLLRNLMARAVVVEVECASQWVECRELVVEAALSGAPVLLLTGRVEPHGDRGFRQRALEYGCAAFVIKPCSVDLLVRTIELLDAGKMLEVDSSRLSTA